MKASRNPQIEQMYGPKTISRLYLNYYDAVAAHLSRWEVTLGVRLVVNGSHCRESYWLLWMGEPTMTILVKQRSLQLCFVPLIHLTMLGGMGVLIEYFLQ